MRRRTDPDPVPRLTLVVKPQGRGNWHSWVISCSKPPDLFTVKEGDKITMGTWKFRIVKVTL